MIVAFVVFVLFRYDNQLLVQYNIKCDEGRLALYEVTEIDLQGRDCLDNGKQRYRQIEHDIFSHEHVNMSRASISP